MTINNYAGVLYDAICYNIICFNKDRMRTLFKIYAEKEEDMFIFYDEFRKGRNAIDPPENLYPFFYFDIKYPCVMTEYFRIKFNFLNGTYTDYFNLFKDVNTFKRYVIYFYLENAKSKINIEAVINGDIKEISKALISLRTHGEERANTFIDLFYNFETLVDDLVKYLNIVLHKMKLFHAKKKGLYQSVIDKFCSSDNLNILKKSYGIKDEVKISKQIFSVSFMQPYIFLYRYKNNDLDYSFIIGYISYISIQKYMNYSYITCISAGKIFGNEIINDIIKELRKEELTITKLSMKLNLSRATTDRFIGILYDELVIQIARANGNEKYYKINPEYFLAAKSVLNQEIDDILLDFQKT